MEQTATCSAGFALTNRIQNDVIGKEDLRNGGNRQRMNAGFFKRLISGMMVAMTLAALFCVVLLGGIKGLSNLFVVSGDRAVSQPERNNTLTQVGTNVSKEMPDVAIQAVFVTDEEGRLCRCFYTLLDCQIEKMEFYMVPLDTRLQMSAELYQELVTKNAKLAQVNTLEGLYRCFPATEAAACTIYCYAPKQL